MNRWFSISDEEKRIAYNNISSSSGIPAHAVEKDWWVVQTLTVLFELEIGKHLVFKGGTSLSKAWDIIKRFSEDIDLSVDRTFFNFEGKLGSSQKERLRRASKKYITETLYPNLQERMKAKGLEKIQFDIEETKSSVQDPVVIYVNYPFVIPSPGSEYISPRVKIEIGCRSLREPFEVRPIISLIDEQYSKNDFSQKEVLIPTVLPERTFLEKIFLLHEEFLRPSGTRKKVERMSRHLYDVYKLSSSKHADAALGDKALYQTIVDHRFCFTKWSGLNYNFHQPQSISIIPPEDNISDWHKDYDIMKEEMFYGEYPSFDELIEALRILNNKINTLQWRMDINFE